MKPIYAHVPATASSPADLVRELDLAVGDTIACADRIGGKLEFTRLTLLWVGEEVAVWRVKRRWDGAVTWRDDGENAYWNLTQHRWSKVDDSDG